MEILLRSGRSHLRNHEKSGVRMFILFAWGESKQAAGTGAPAAFKLGNRYFRISNMIKIVFLCFLTSVSLSYAAEEIIKDAQGMDCHLYTPDQIDPDKTYQLLVGVHGAGGKGNGAAGLKSWVERGDVIVIGPSFQTKGDRPYQNGDGPHAEKLIELFEQLKERFKLTDKMFLHGFSGGSQFTHRFAMNHPKYVCGVSAHSGGSWATDTYGNINSKAKKIPFAISCGEKDTGKAWGDAPFNRLDWFKRFRDEIAKKNFCHIAKSWPDQGHRISPGAWDLMRQCFQIATGLPGASATEKVEISGDWENLDEVAAPEFKPKAAPTVPSIDPARLASIAKAAFARADQEEIPADKLVAFMEKYPPILWKEMDGSEKLLAQCEAAASAWKKAAMESDRFSGRIREKFESFANGLEAAK